MKLAGRDHDEPMIRGALISSLLPHMAVVATNLRGLPTLTDPVLRVALAEKKDEIILAAATSMMSDAARLDEMPLRSFRTVLQLLSANGVTLEKLAAQHSGEAAWTDVAAKKAKLIVDLKTVANDAGRPASSRAFVSTVLLADPGEEPAAVAALGGLVGVKENAEPFAELVSLLAQSKDARVPDFLMQDWDARTPAQRLTLLDAVMGREMWAIALLGQVKDGKISASNFDAQRQARLLKHPSERVRHLASAAFSGAATASRAKVLETFQPALALKGDATKGKVLFATACAACHQLEGVGRVLGPDLRSVVGHEPSKLLSSILDPSAIIEPGFTAYFLRAEKWRATLPHHQRRIRRQHRFQARRHNRPQYPPQRHREAAKLEGIADARRPRSRADAAKPRRSDLRSEDGEVNHPHPIPRILLKVTVPFADP